jgi:hypothetical protein
LHRLRPSFSQYIITDEQKNYQRRLSVVSASLMRNIETRIYTQLLTGERAGVKASDWSP